MEEVITMVSEEIKSFLDFVEESRILYTYALEQIKQEEKRQTDLLHSIEFESSCKERGKLSTGYINAGKTGEDSRTWQRKGMRL